MDSGSDKYSDVFFISNAGTLGPLGNIGSADMTSARMLENAYRINLLAPSYMMNEFVRRFQSSATSRLMAVNISSLWAVEPAKSFSAYCTAKAGMDMFMRTLAKETEAATGPSIKTLNFAPGPLDTKMQEQIRTTASVDEGTRQWSVEAAAGGKYVSLEASADKCVKIMMMSRFASGDHVDYYDQVEGVDFPLTTPTECCACSFCECGPSCACGNPNAPAPQCDPCAVFVASRNK
jgi:sepiapterin reductase